MKTSVNMIRKMGNFDVTQRTKDSFFNATELIKQWNNYSGQKKEVTKFFELDNTKEFIYINQCKFDIKKGRYGGTWMDEKLINRFYDWLTSNTVGYRQNKEILFFDALENISGIQLERQFSVLNYKIDSVFIEYLENYGDYDVDKDTLKSITCFEFDEKHHKKQINSDINRLASIIIELKKEYDIVKIYRISEENQYDFLKYAIAYYGAIETSYSSEMLRKYSFNLYVMKDKSFEELLNEMRRIYHQIH